MHRWTSKINWVKRKSIERIFTLWRLLRFFFSRSLSLFSDSQGTSIVCLRRHFLHNSLRARQSFVWLHLRLFLRWPTHWSFSNSSFTCLPHSFSCWFGVGSVTKCLRRLIIRFVYFIIRLRSLRIHVNWNVSPYVFRQSVMIAQSAFNCHWYERDERFKQIIRFVIRRSQQPIVFRASYFYALNFETFISVCWNFVSLRFFAFLFFLSHDFSFL